LTDTKGKQGSTLRSSSEISYSLIKIDGRGIVEFTLTSEQQMVFDVAAAFGEQHIKP